MTEQKIPAFRIRKVQVKFWLLLVKRGQIYLPLCASLYPSVSGNSNNDSQIVVRPKEQCKGSQPVALPTGSIQKIRTMIMILIT